VHANPDGNDLVADWYMRNPDPRQRSLAQLPRLYQKYIGHDDNRDFFMSTQAETENENHVLYNEWFPQILYNHHQSGPAGTVVYSPPLRDPYNYNLDPMLILGLQSLGAAMHTRLASEGKGGATMRGGGPYDGWWNGGIRNTATFHNTIAMLTEIIGSPTPMRIPLVLARQIPSGDIAMPIAPQEWHMRQSIEYSTSLDRAVLDYASRMRENLLFNIYRMGRSSIERGSSDTWTANPRRDAEIAGRMGDASDSVKWAAMKAPALRDPRGYIIPSSQADFPTATKFINALLETGIAVDRATIAFTVNGKEYPAGSYVVRTAQAFRPHIMDMFEPQVHPDVIPYPGANPTPPYDNAGWTLAYQMGIQFDRVLDAFAGPFERIEGSVVPPMPGTLSSKGSPIAGFVVSGRVNDAVIVVNRALRRGDKVSRLADGSWFLPSSPGQVPTLRENAIALGVSFEGVPAMPEGARNVRAPRIGLWDTYGGSMTAGWTRWILEQFEFPFERVFAPALDRGSLNDKFDVLVFVDGAIPGTSSRRGGGGGAAANDTVIPYLPAEYRDQVGRMSIDRTLPRIREFIEKGGTVVTIGSSATNLAAFLKLPIESQLAENGVALPRTKFYVPGSVLSARVKTDDPIGWGMAEHTNMFFDDSPVFKLGADAAAKGVHAIAWFDSKTPLRSGWAWGQGVLENGVVAAEARVGQGRVLMFGPEILQRAQPHGTFKFLFNSIFASVW
ncbi:MAG: peptidase, partial [Gemmatimonadaceae bacterium]